MKVILKEQLNGFGKAGDIVKVSNGYARNYLIPRDLATIATKKNIGQLKHEKHQIYLRQEKAKREALKLAEELKKTQVTLPRQVGEEDRIFGSVTTRDVADFLRQEGFKVTRKQIRVEESINKTGVYESHVKLHPEVEAVVKVWVVAL
jgi:large subunit ribosomal protein L9